MSQRYSVSYAARGGTLPARKRKRAGGKKASTGAASASEASATAAETQRTPTPNIDTGRTGPLWTPWSHAPILPRLLDLYLEMSEDGTRCRLLLVTDWEVTDQLTAVVSAVLKPKLPRSLIIDAIELVGRPLDEEFEKRQAALPFHREVRDLIAIVLLTFQGWRLLLCAQKCLRRLPRDTAIDPDDLVQTAIDYLIDGKLNWHGSLPNLMKTLFVTIRNLSWNHGEAEIKNQALEGEDYVDADWSDADWKAVITLLNGDLEAALQLLSAAEREVLLMRYVENMKPAEIAKVRKRSVHTVKTQLKKAKAALRESGRLDAYRVA